MFQYAFLFGVILTANLFGAPTPPPKQGYPLENPNEKKQTGPKKPVQPLVRPPALPSLNVSTIFSSPGIATLEGSEWVGSDHLFNLPASIGVVVEIVKPSSISSVTSAPTTAPGATGTSAPVALGLNVLLIEEKIKEIVSNSLKNIKMKPRDLLLERGTPLPFLHFLIILNPVEKGYVAYIAGRLFETVQSNRIFLKTGITFQAITWEKQELIIAPPEQLQQQILETIQTIIASFSERIKNYALEKPQK